MQSPNENNILITSTTIELDTTTQSLDQILKSNSTTMSRKRVRFDTESDEPERVKVRVVETLRPSSAMTKEEKDSAWYQKQSFHENIQNARLYATMLACRSNVDENAKCYSDALASTYASCAIDNWEDFGVSEHCAQHLALLTNVQHAYMDGESARGLEKVAVPLVGQEAVRRRNEVIGSVLFAQFAIGEGISPHERQELIRTISEEQSKCARKFAKAMGTADAMSALIEYDMSSRESMGTPMTKIIAKHAKPSCETSNVSLLSTPISQNSMVVKF